MGVGIPKVHQESIPQELCHMPFIALDDFRADFLVGMKRTPSSRQKRARIKIDCYKDEPKYTDAGV
jgi:hypothetical protein